jgi:Domain of unknown function (DUF2382)
MISQQLNHHDHNSDVAYHTKVDSTSNILTQASFSLLEERLRIELTQRKIGEIVIRKEIETELVQVPVRREKLIIEQVSPAYKLLAEIDLGQPVTASDPVINPINNNKEFRAIELDPPPQNSEQRMTPPTVYGSTDSLNAASELLKAIASLPKHDCGVVRIEISLKDPKHQANYQALVDRYFQA